jgi:O-antigen/teichoic acid export membrane protein
MRLVTLARSRPVLWNMVALLGGTAGAQLFTAVALLLTARVLGSDAFGQYAACFALATLTSIVFTFGMDGWLLQQGSASRADVEARMSNSLLARLLIGLPWFVAIGFLAPMLNPTAYPRELMWIVAATVWMDGLLAGCLAAFKAMLRVHLTSPLLTGTAGTLLAATLALAWLQNASVQQFALARLSINLMVLGGTLAWLFSQGALRLQPRHIGAMLSTSIPFAVSEALTLVYLKADTTIIAWQLGEQAAGLYAPATSLASALFLIPSVIYTVMVPVFGRLINQSEVNSSSPAPSPQHPLNSMIAKVMLGGTGLGLMLATALWLTAPTLVSLLLGSDYTETGRVLQILSILLVFRAGSFSVAALLVAANQQHKRLVVQAVAAAVNVALNLLIIQQMGIHGVAWVYVLTEALLFLGYVALAWRWWTALNARHAATPSSLAH